MIDVDARGTFTVEDVIAALDRRPAPRVLAVTGASNVTGWLPDLAAIAAAARERGGVRRGRRRSAGPASAGGHDRPRNRRSGLVRAQDVRPFRNRCPDRSPGFALPRGKPLLVGGGAVKAVTYDGGDVQVARAAYAAATGTWAALIQHAVTSEGIPAVARAAGCSRTTVYARTRGATDTPAT